MPRSSFYRLRGADQRAELDGADRAPPPRALNREERIDVRSTLNSERFQDLAPRQVYAALLDEGEYLCHWRTMYRVLEEHDEVRERRKQFRHPSYEKPELLATGPNQVWSWDITRLMGPAKWTYYYLYVILDIYSRYVVGWMVAGREAASLARELIRQTCVKQHIQREQLLANLGVSKSHSRPHVSDDNPYSEAQFRTLKYRPDYPERFGCDADARAWARSFFRWYNNEHYHSALGLLTPADVHYGRADQILQKRRQVLYAAYEKNPERFVKGVPKPAELPGEVWINPPKKVVEETDDNLPSVELTQSVNVPEQSKLAAIVLQDIYAGIAAIDLTDAEIRA